MGNLHRVLSESSASGLLYLRSELTVIISKYSSSQANKHSSHSSSLGNYSSSQSATTRLFSATAFFLKEIVELCFKHRAAAKEIRTISKSFWYKSEHMLSVTSRLARSYLENSPNYFKQSRLGTLTISPFWFLWKWKRWDSWERKKAFTFNWTPRKK